METGPDGLIYAVDQVLPDPEDQLLILIDQFEEVFTLVGSEELRTQFLKLIWTAVGAADGRIRIVLTLRADFFDRPLQYRKLAERFRQQTTTMIPLSAEEMSWAITRPAEQFGVHFEPELVAAMVADVQDQPGGLPLIQFALSELFERRNRDEIQIQDYEAIGRVTGALASRAEQIYSKLNPQQRHDARQLFLRLVTLSPEAQPTRRRAPRNELRAASPQPEAMDRVIDQFTDYRLLSLDHDRASRQPTVELAHEALLSAWTRLANWLDVYQADLELRRQLTLLASEWESARRDASYLLRGHRLDQLEGWRHSTELALTDLEREFIEFSLKRRERRQTREAERQVREALLEERVLRQVSMGLAAQSLQALKGRHPEHAIPLALEALENYPYTAQAHSALSQAVLGQRIDERIPTGGYVYRSQLSAAGDLLLVSVAESDALVWDIQRQARRYTLKGSRAEGVCWSPDERLILTVQKDRTGFDLWSAETGKHLPKPVNQDDLGVGLSIWSVRNWQPWAPDNQRFVMAHPDGVVRVWDAQLQEVLYERQAHDGSFQAYWSLSAEQIVTWGEHDGRMKLWDPETGELLYELSGGARFGFDQWSADDKYFVISESEKVRVIESKSGEERHLFELPDAIIFDAKFSPDGQWLVATEPFRGITWLWNMETGKLKATLTGDQQAYAASWASDSQRVAVSYLGGMQIWDIYSDISIRKIILGDYPYNLSWSPDNQRLYGSGTGAKEIFVIRTNLAKQLLTGSLFDTGGQLAWLDEDRIIGRYGSSGEIQLYESETLELLHQFNGGSSWGEIMLHPDKKRVFSVNTDGKMQARSMIDGRILLERHDVSWLFGASLSPDGKLLTAYGGDGGQIGWAIYCYDSDSFEEMWKLPEERSFAGMPAWSPDGERLAVSLGFGRRAAIVNPKNGEIQTWLFTESDDYVYIAGLAWSSDGKQLAVNVDRGGVILDVESGEELTRLSGLDGTVWGFQWVADDAYLLTTNSSEGKLRVFDTRSGETILIYDVGGWPWGQISVDQSRMLVFAHDGSTRLYPFWQTVDDLIAYAYKHSPETELSDPARAAYGLTDLQSGQG